MRKLKKGGFSVVEAVIALTVVIIVSISALTVVLSSINAKQAAINKSYAQEYANSALESFKNANNHGSFVQNLHFAEGATGLSSIGDTNSGSKEYTYTSASHAFTAKMTVSYPTSDTHKFSITITGKNDAEILSFEYEKSSSAEGGGG